MRSPADARIGCATQGVERDERVGVTIADDVTHFVVALGLASLGAAHATLATPRS